MGILDLWNKGKKSHKEVIQQAIAENRAIRIDYRKFSGESSSRKISDITYNNSYEDDGFHDDHIKGYCHLREEERTFKISRINSIEIL